MRPLALMVVLLLAGCGARDRTPELPETSILIGRNQVALVRVEYARFHERPGMESPIIAHARAGDILLLRERTPDAQWLLVERSRPEGETAVPGWVHVSDVALYDSHAQARNARAREETAR
ncbi:MAG: hypothetical protein EA427_08840 [Spirochaetaceae bacterium]|nr:MAG: hypothetical protein EA427_08840 [Spirochaetaceae bacterium]